jgi:hypothetical protein
VLKARGVVDGETTVRAQLVLERYNLAEKNPRAAPTHELVRRAMRGLFALLWHPQAERAASENGESPAAAGRAPAKADLAAEK